MVNPFGRYITGMSSTPGAPAGADPPAAVDTPDDGRTDDVVAINVPIGPIHGKAAVRTDLEDTYVAFPDLRFVLEDTEIYLSDLQPAMKPSDAFAHIAHRKTERVEIDHLEGRVTTSLITPYPPGIPLLIPGEVFNKKIVDYLKFARAFNLECPGFETDIHGLVSEVDATGKLQYFADCVEQ